MSKLYITDLDGTLLDSHARISQFSETVLSELLEQGMELTVATGRSPISLDAILKNVPLHLPVIIMNGAAVYDRKKKECIDVCSISHTSLVHICESEKIAGIQGYYIGIRQKQFQYFSCKDKTEPLKKYLSAFPSEIKERDMHWNEREYDDILYALYMDDHPERLEKLYQELKKDPGLTVDHYKDIYKENCWCIELMSANATKGAGAVFLKKFLGYKEVVGFGNDWNDHSLFEICDERYAVKNALLSLKEEATAIIGSNEEDGVAKQLLQLWRT